MHASSAVDEGQLALLIAEEEDLKLSVVTHKVEF